MTPPRPLSRPAVRTATILGFAGLVLAGGLLAGCGRHRQAVRFKPKDFGAEIAKIVGLAEPEPEPVASSAPAVAAPPTTLWPTPTPTPLQTAPPVPAGPTDPDRALDRVAETLREYNRLQRERRQREAAAAFRPPPVSPSPLPAADTFSTPLPTIGDAPDRFY